MLLLQIVDYDGRLVRFPAGGDMERDFVAAVTAKLGSFDVGMFRTKKQVMAAMSVAITEVIHDLKNETRNGFVTQ